MATSRRLVRLHCPFWALVFRPVGPYREGQWVRVEQVKGAACEVLAFYVEGTPYRHRHFAIILPQNS